MRIFFEQSDFNHLLNVIENKLIAPRIVYNFTYMSQLYARKKHSKNSLTY
ncbi:MAG: hypothetical protein N5P05_000783 [Chroococcopsis gigantea SAG 12.99]|nr:hypothetical protein [Chroococcopsis gigantea SAG 12.99]